MWNYSKNFVPGLWKVIIIEYHILKTFGGNDEDHF